MKKSRTNLEEIKLVGITARTNTAAEMTPDQGKIGKTLETYFGQNLPEQISNRKSPGKTYCVYTEYESDETGDYTYFVGEEVTSFEGINPNFDTLSIPAQSYAQFKVGPGEMPQVCIEAWQKIWQMKPEDFGSKRSYISDFEIYDERAEDPKNSIFDIYVGIE
jgi:predicted transcriptional regulator YdeE